MVCESPLIIINNRWSNSIEGYEILCRRLNSRENHRVFLRLNPVLCPVFGNRWMLRSRDFLYSYFLFQIISESNSRKWGLLFSCSRKNLVNLVSFWVLKRSNSSQRYKNHNTYIWFISYLGNILYLKTIVGKSIKLWVCARTMKSLKLHVAQRRRRSVELSGKSSCAIILTKHFHMKIMNSARFKQLGTCWRM